MDYYDLLKKDADKFRPLVKNIEGLKKTLSTQRQRRIDETSTQERLKKHYAKLQAQAGDDTVSDQGEWAKYRTSIRKTASEIEATAEIIESLDAMTLRTTNEIRSAESDLDRQLLEFAKASRGICETRITAIVDQIIAEMDSYLSALEKIYTECSAAFKPGLTGTSPRCIHPMIAELGHECEFRQPGPEPETPTPESAIPEPEKPEPPKPEPEPCIATDDGKSAVPVNSPGGQARIAEYKARAGLSE